MPGNNFLLKCYYSSLTEILVKHMNYSNWGDFLEKSSLHEKAGLDHFYLSYNVFNLPVRQQVVGLESAAGEGDGERVDLQSK